MEDGVGLLSITIKCLLLPIEAWVKYMTFTDVTQMDAGAHLYNLKDDLGQENDLAKQYPEKLSEMKQLLKQAHQPNDYFYFGKPKPPKKKKQSVKKG